MPLHPLIFWEIVEFHSCFLCKESRLQVGVPHQALIHHSCRVAALTQGPYHKALAAAHIAAGEHLGHVGGILGIGHGAALGQVYAKGFGHIGLAAGETSGNQHQIALHGKLLTGRHHLAAAHGE